MGELGELNILAYYKGPKGNKRPKRKKGPKGKKRPKRDSKKQQKAVWDGGSLALLIKMSVKIILFILRCVQGSGPEEYDVL